ncbi:MAG: TPM domain-containing protein [Bacteriovoracaceae bacterium]|nr:TPM domain-containing protein [Bacteriovoracaceae bacterium]
MKHKSQFTSPEVTHAISNFENTTGYELVVAVCTKSDPYPGAIWRGAVLFGLLCSILFLHFYDFSPKTLEVLVVGLFILVSVYVVKWTKLFHFFITSQESSRETREKAAELFSKFQSNRIGHQASLLLFFSLVERKMHLLVDKDLNEKLSPEDLQETITLLRMHFKQGNFQDGLKKSIEILEKKILQKAGKNPNPCQFEVPDRIFWLNE